MQALCVLLNLYTLAIFGRIILSWFPIDSGSGLAPVRSFLFSITEPVLGPVRRALPPFGMLDLSPILVVIGLRIVGAAVLGC